MLSSLRGTDHDRAMRAGGGGDGHGVDVVAREQLVEVIDEGRLDDLGCCSSPVRIVVPDGDELGVRVLAYQAAYSAAWTCQNPSTATLIGLLGVIGLLGTDSPPSSLERMLRSHRRLCRSRDPLGVGKPHSALVPTAAAPKTTAQWPMELRTGADFDESAPSSGVRVLPRRLGGWPADATATPPAPRRRLLRDALAS